MISTNLHYFSRKVFKFTAKMSGLVAKLPPIVMGKLSIFNLTYGADLPDLGVRFIFIYKLFFP